MVNDAAADDEVECLIVEWKTLVRRDLKGRTIQPKLRGSRARVLNGRGSKIDPVNGRGTQRAHRQRVSPPSASGVEDALALEPSGVEAIGFKSRAEKIDGLLEVGVVVRGEKLAEKLPRPLLSIQSVVRGRSVIYGCRGAYEWRAGHDWR